MSKHTKKKKSPPKNPPELPPEDPGGPGPPETPPGTGARVPEANTASEPSAKKLEPASPDAYSHAPTHTQTTTNVAHVPSTREGGDKGQGSATLAATSAPAESGSGMTHCQHDERVESRPEENVGRITQSKTHSSTGVPNMGRPRSDTAGSQASASTPASTAAEFYASMSTIMVMGDFSKTISARLGQTID